MTRSAPGASVTALPDWGAAPATARRKPDRALVFGAAFFVLVIGVLLWLAPGAALAAGLLGAPAAGFVRHRRRQGSFGLEAARPLEAAGAPRFRNVAAGLAGELGVAEPSLWLIEEGGPNARVGWDGGPAIAVTASLLESYTRTELEAVVAHCLVRLAPGHPRRLASPAGPDDDLRAAAVTRYPPALASAIRKAEPRGGWSARLWFVGETPGEVTPEERALSVADL